jgi:dephospho-CoA kinase
MPFSAPKRSCYKIGVTGGLCSGKSLVCSLMAKYGANVLQVETLLPGVLEFHPELVQRLEQYFGPNSIRLPSGQFDRNGLQRLGPIIVSHRLPDSLQRLIQPLLREEIKHFLFGRIGGNIRAVESPMLFETNSQHLYDEIWLVNATPEQQRARLIARDKLAPLEASRELSAQAWHQSLKQSQSQIVIDNTGEPHVTAQQVSAALDAIRQKLHFYARTS